MPANYYYQEPEKTGPLVNIVGNLQSVNFSIDNFKHLREEDHLYVDKSVDAALFLRYERGFSRIPNEEVKYGYRDMISSI